MNRKSETYLIPVLSRALDVLEAFQSPTEQLSLQEIIKRTGISYTTAYRILYTLEHRGYVARLADKTYRLSHHRRKIRIGYAEQSAALPFSAAVTEGMRKAAAASSVELVYADNAYSGKVAIENVDKLIEQQINLLIEFQTDESVAAIISDRVTRAGIPMIAIEIPHPGAIFLGVDNFRFGFEAGKALGRFARTRWQGRVDQIILFDLEQAGPTVRARMTGVFAAIQEILPLVNESILIRCDGTGLFDETYARMKELLRAIPRARRILVSAVNDNSALGALAAARDAGRLEHVAVAGHDCTEAAQQEIRKRGGRYIASVSQFPESYGSLAIGLALRMLKGEAVPPFNYVKHRLITARNIDDYYPPVNL